MPEENRKSMSVVASDRVSESIAAPRPNEPLNRRRLRRVARGMAAWAVALCISMAAVAEDVRWINPAGGNFGESGNWDAGRVPGSGDHAIIELEGTYTVNLDADATIGGLTLGGQSGTQTLATEVSRTLSLGYHPVLIREPGVLRHRGTVDQLSQFDNHGLIVLRSASLTGEGLVFYELDLINHPGATIRAERTARIEGNVVNDGLIQVEDAEPDTYVALVSGGLIVNRGLIAVGRGGGGRRNVGARIENEATGVIRTETSAIFEEDLVNHGTIEAIEGELECAILVTDGTVRVVPHAAMFVVRLTYNGGEFGGPGSTIVLTRPSLERHYLSEDLIVPPTMNLVLDGAVFNLSGSGRIDNAGTLTALRASTFRFTNRTGALAVFYDRARPSDCVNEPGALMRIVERDGSAYIDFSGSGLRNDGLIEVTSELTDGRVSISCWVELVNSGRIAFMAGAGNVTYSLDAGAIDNTEAGRIEINAETDIDADSILNAGSITAAAHLSIDAEDHLENSGVIDCSGGNLAVHFGDTDVLDRGLIALADGHLEIGHARLSLPNEHLHVTRGTLGLRYLTVDLLETPDNLVELTEVVVAGPAPFANRGDVTAFESTFQTPLINEGTISASECSFHAPVDNAGTLNAFECTFNGPFANRSDGTAVLSANTDVHDTFANEAGAVLIVGRSYRVASVALHQPFVNQGVVRLETDSRSLDAWFRPLMGFVNEGLLVLAARGMAAIDLPGAPLTNHGRIEILPSPNGNADAIRRIIGAFVNAEDGEVLAERAATIGAQGSPPVNEGTLSIVAGRLTTPSDVGFVNRGLVRIDPDGSLVPGRVYVQESGETRLAGGLLSGSVVDIRAGDLTGVGTVTPLLINAGHVRPGAPVGGIDVWGGYWQKPEGSLHIDIAGRAPGQFDRLAVTGAAALGGAIEIAAIGGFEPTPGDRFAVVTASPASGRFEEATLPCLAPTGRMDLIYTPAEVQVAVEPPLTGDLNCDCAADAFDIEPFVLALSDPAGYGAAYPGCDINLADLNGDGRVDASDIQPFIERLLE